LNVYVDSSVLLRIAFGEPQPLRAWRRIDRAVASEIIRLECRRTVDRARIRNRLDDVTVAQLRATVQEILEAFDLVPVNDAVLERAAEPFPTLLGSLDAIHLATALMARENIEDLHFATHDEELAVAAHAMGFTVLGARPHKRKTTR
jgi:predicted nucleic acid-binding protein